MERSLKMKILVTPTSLCKNDAMLKRLSEAGELVLNTAGRPLTEEELIPMIGDIDGYLAGLDFITDKVIGAAHKLKIISRYGVGYERVDIKAASEAGIEVTNTPGANSQSVAELAFGMMFALARNIPYLNDTMKKGEWQRTNGSQLFGKTLGIVGLGAIGRALAVMATGCSMKIIAYDPFINREWASANGVSVGTFDDVISASDFISLHIPHTPETHNIINDGAINKMKDGAIIINTSRGGLIDEDAAEKYIASGKLGGIGLDAFSEEPPKMHKLYTYNNVILTPHTGAHTAEAVNNMAELAISNLIGALNGKDDYKKCLVSCR